MRLRNAGAERCRRWCSTASPSRWQRDCSSRQVWMGCSPMWGQLDAARGSAQRIQFSGGWALGHADESAPRVTAEQVVNQADEKDLADLIYEFGEERRSRRIARAIVRARPITTTAQLARSRFGWRPDDEDRSGILHPATRTFQALRIHVNGELGEIEGAAGGGAEAIEAGGKAGGDQLPLSRGPACQGRAARRSAGNL